MSVPDAIRRSSSPAPRERGIRLTARVLVIGAGGREHALAWGLDRSPLVDEVICAPGNPGMATIGECLPIVPTDPAAVADLATKLDPDARRRRPGGSAGCRRGRRGRRHRDAGRSVRRAAAARLEGSKAWMKDVLVARGRAHRAARELRAGHGSRGVRVSRHAGRPVRGQDRRARRGQGRRRHRIDSPKRATLCVRISAAPRSVTRAAPA